MQLRLTILALAAVNASGRREKGRHLRVPSSERNLHTHLSPYETQDGRTNKSKLARDDHGERDAYIPISERDGTSYEYSQSVDGVDVNVSVNVNVEVNTGGQSAPPPTPEECLKWDISYVTEVKNQYFQYQYYSSKSGKSTGKSGKSTGKSGKSKGKSGQIMMKEVEVKKQVKTCVETMPPVSKIETVSPTPSPIADLEVSCPTC